jgi:serine/threonine protein kinase/WD40 repeat protein
MPLTADSVLTALTDCGVLSADELPAAAALFPDSQWPADPGVLLDGLFRAGRITQFQAQTLYAGRGETLLLGDYVLLEPIGAGGMGQVFKARHRRMKREVALKILPPAVQQSPDFIARFQREVEAAARLTHPNVVTAYDAGESRGVHYLVTEYVAGSDLASVVRQQGPVPAEAAVELLQQIAAGLDYAHRQGVIHRDIKPNNILVSRDGVVKVADLGLARLLTSSEQPAAVAAPGLTNTGAVMGTIDYMAPEQAEDTHRADERSDIYSLGCTLFFLLTGQPPFPGGTVVQKILAHREQAPPRLAVPATPADAPANSQLLAALDGLLQRLLAKRPEDRCQDMAEVLAALEPLRSGSLDLTRTFAVCQSSAALPPANQNTQQGTDAQVPTVHPPGTAPLPTIEVGSSVRVTHRLAGRRSTTGIRRQGLIAAALGVCLLVVTFGIWQATSGHKPEPPRSPTVAAPRGTTSPPVATKAGSTAPQVPAPDLDPARIPEFEQSPGQPKELVAVLGSSARRHGKHVTGLAYTADGRYLLSGSHDGWLIAWDADTLERRARFQLRSSRWGPTEDGIAPIHHLVWDEPRQSAWLGMDDGTIRQVEFQQEAFRELVSWPVFAAPITQLAVSPDGRWLASVSRSQPQVKMWNLQVTPPELTATMPRLGEYTDSVAVAFRPDGQRLYVGAANKLQVWDITALEDESRPENWSPPEIDAPLIGEHREGTTGTILFDPTGRELAVNFSSTLYLWRGTEQDRFEQTAAIGLGGWAAYSPDGRWLATNTNSYETVQLFDRGRSDWQSSLLRLGLNALGSGGARVLAFRPDSQRLVIGDHWGKLRQWDLATTPPTELSPHPIGSQPLDVIFSPRGDQLIVCGRDYGSTLWQHNGSEFVERHRWPTGIRSRCASWSADGEWLAFVLESDQQKPAAGLYHRERDELVRVNLPATGGGLAGLALAADARQLAAGMGGGQIEVLRRERLDEAFTPRETLQSPKPEGDYRAAHSLSFFPDGDQLAVAYPYHAVVLFDFRTTPPRVRAELPFVLSALEPSGQVIGFTPDGHSLIVGGNQSMVWDLSVDQPRRHSTAGWGGVLSVSPSGRFVVVASGGGTILIYDSRTLVQRHTYQLPQGVAAVDWHPSGAYIATANSNGTVWILKVPDELR